LNGSVAIQVEELPENRVRLTVQVPSHDVHHAVEHAATDLAASVKIPGFRKGKVPRQVLLQRVGRERLMTEAVESHISGWFWNAATQTRLRPVAQPQFDFELPASEDQDWEFTATVSVQAKPELADWTTLEVGRSSPRCRRSSSSASWRRSSPPSPSSSPSKDGRSGRTTPSSSTSSRTAAARHGATT
jgi:FKBP-type peptidyl-prolyl cis-trans isomerase (trigger factor)